MIKLFMVLEPWVLGAGRSGSASCIPSRKIYNNVLDHIPLLLSALSLLVFRL